MTRALAALVAVAALSLLGVGPAAAAEPATGAEVQRLAVAAAHDPAALARLRRIDLVDGRKVDLGGLLRGDRATVVARLRTLAAGRTELRVAAARADARRILAGRDFHPHHPPRPLRAPLRWIGERLRPVAAPVARFFDGLATQGDVATVLAVVVMLLAAVGGTLVVRRRNLAILGEGGGRGGGRSTSPEALERQAVRAEREGDHEAALRLRFRAGLLRLDAVGALRYRPSLTTGAVVEQVPSATLAGLAATLDEVVYGERAASSADVEAARAGWPRVLAEAGHP